MTVAVIEPALVEKAVQFAINVPIAGAIILAVWMMQRYQREKDQSDQTERAERAKLDRAEREQVAVATREQADRWFLAWQTWNLESTKQTAQVLEVIRQNGIAFGQLKEAVDGLKADLRALSCAHPVQT